MAEITEVSKRWDNLLTCFTSPSAHCHENQKILNELWRNRGKYFTFNRALVKYPNYTLYHRDLQSLKGQNWVNDSIIHAYIQLLKEEYVENKPGPGVLISNTFFFDKVNESVRENNYEEVNRYLTREGGFLLIKSISRWLDNESIFGRVWYIPIHVLENHWTLLEIDASKMPEIIMTYYDSKHDLYGYSHKAFQLLEAYITHMAINERKQSVCLSMFHGLIYFQIVFQNSTKSMEYLAYSKRTT